MSRHSVVRVDLFFGMSDLHITIDQMLRSGLLKVYPLPLDQGTTDARFDQLLEALRARSQGDSHLQHLTKPSDLVEADEGAA